jgi:hypothetical protein
MQSAEMIRSEGNNRTKHVTTLRGLLAILCGKYKTEGIMGTVFLQYMYVIM